MSKAFANPRIFVATCLLFVGATVFNLTANASVSSEVSGKGLRVVPNVSVSEPVLKVGPTFPPSPWDDDAPSVTASR
jgi:hypothetical protein